MRTDLSFLLLFFLSMCAVAQTGTVTGIVRDSESNGPLTATTVFLSNATKGTQTNDKGYFSLTSVKPGQYDLVVSYVGYETFVKRISVDNGLQHIEVKLQRQNVQLREVVIGRDPNWAKNYANFKRIFIGRSENASVCSIVNPKVLSLYYDKDTKKLEASSDEFLIIDNSYLGYRLKFLLKEFEWQNVTGLTYYAGQVLFEDMKGGEARVKRWKKNRRKTFFGSNMHFFRALRSNSIVEEGYRVNSIVSKQIPGRPADTVIIDKINYFRRPENSNADSLQYWNELYRSPKAIRILGKDILQASDIAKRTNVPNIYALHYHADLQVVYTKEKIYDPSISRNTYPTSVVNIKAPPVFFDPNGIVINSRSVIYEGSWNKGVVELLPHDYEPE